MYSAELVYFFGEWLQRSANTLSIVTEINANSPASWLPTVQLLRPGRSRHGSFTAIVRAAPTRYPELSSRPHAVLSHSQPWTFVVILIESERRGYCTQHSVNTFDFINYVLAADPQICSQECNIL